MEQIFKKSTKKTGQIFWASNFLIGEQLLVFPKKSSQFNSIILNSGETSSVLIKKDVLNLVNLDSVWIGKYGWINLIMAIAKYDFSQVVDDSININDEEITGEEADLSSLKKIKINKDKYKLSIMNLKEILDNESSKEVCFEKWIEDNRWIFAGTEIIDNQFRLNTNHGISRPDFLFCDPFGKGRNILEIKGADFELLKFDSSHKTYYWASEISKSISQVRKYLDDLNENPRIGNHVTERITINTYGVILAGRTKGCNLDLMWSLNGLNNELRNIKIISYDILLENLEKNWKNFYESDKNE